MTSVSHGGTVFIYFKPCGGIYYYVSNGKKLCTTVCTKYIYTKVSQNVQYKEIIISEDVLCVLTKIYGVPFPIIMVYMYAQ